MARTPAPPAPAGPPAYPAPPPWPTLGTHLVLWHGTVARHAARIKTPPYIDPTRGRPATDFGRGFYTTTVEAQAREWANRLYLRDYPFGNPADPPAVLKFRVRLDALAGLDGLAFVRGDPNHEPFWSLIHHARASAGRVVNTHRHPGRKAPNDWYDVVSGPVAGLPLRYRKALGRWSRPHWYALDQYSFHTPAGVAVLNALIASGSPADFDVLTLPPPSP